MKVTKLHLILFCIIVLVCGGYVYQIQQEKMKQAEAAAASAEKDLQRIRADMEKLKKDQLEKKKLLALQTISVAGECMDLAVREERDVVQAQSVLRSAKEAFDRNEFDISFELARESMPLFRTAPFKKVYYVVRRGDSLWRISAMPKHFNDPLKWNKIWRANRKKIRDFDLIYPKQNLLIPKDRR